jgi:membrane protein involved in colicin uptake
MEKLDSSTIENIDVTKNGISQNSIKIITRKIESNNLEQAKREAEEAKRYAEQTKRIAEEAKREAEQAKRVAEQAKIDAEKAKKRK